MLRRPVDSAQYLSIRYSERLATNDIVASVGSKGDSYDNAMVESFNSTLEFELLSRRSFATKAEARRHVARFIDRYNRVRRHSSCEMKSPNDYEDILADRAAERANAADAA